MPWMLWNGQFLFRNGLPAMDPRCCCGECCKQIPDTITGTYANGCGTWTFTARKKPLGGVCNVVDWACSNGRSAAQICWEGDEITITCNPPEQGGSGPICDTPRTGRFYLYCGDCSGDGPTGDFFFTWNNCPEIDSMSLCPPFQPVTCPPRKLNCQTALNEKLIRFIDSAASGLICLSCKINECDCDTLTYTW